MAADVLDELNALGAEISQAADALLFAAEAGLSRLEAARAGDAAALDVIEALFCAILEACAFQDLTGQRLSKIERLISGKAATPTGGEASLLNGPALHGHGLNQAAADAVYRLRDSQA
jgi:hypothetical protein